MHRIILVFSLLLSTVTLCGADFEAGRQAYQRGDYVTGLQEWLPLTKRGELAGPIGDVEKQWLTGKAYLHGVSVEQDCERAAFWFVMAAENGHAEAQAFLFVVLMERIPSDRTDLELLSKRVKAIVKPTFGSVVNKARDWLGRSAESGNYPMAQAFLATMYEDDKEYHEAAKWYRRAAEQGNAMAQSGLGGYYMTGSGVEQNFELAVEWLLKAAQQGEHHAQYRLGALHGLGKGVPQDFVQAYMWLNLAASSGHQKYSDAREEVATRMTPQQIAEAQELARNWEPTPEKPEERTSLPDEPIEIISAGTGFVVDPAGFVVTNQHVIDGCRSVTVGTDSDREVKVLAADIENDLALLKLPTEVPSTVASFREGRGARLGEAVIVLGFPLPGLLSSTTNLTTGNISALAGPGDDSQLIQITAPVQGGNSGGPLLDQAGNVGGGRRCTTRSTESR